MVEQDWFPKKCFNFIAVFCSCFNFFLYEYSNWVCRSRLVAEPPNTRNVELYKLFEFYDDRIINLRTKRTLSNSWLKTENVIKLIDTVVLLVCYKQECFVLVLETNKFYISYCNGCNISQTKLYVISLRINLWFIFWLSPLFFFIISNCINQKLFYQIKFHDNLLSSMNNRNYIWYE